MADSQGPPGTYGPGRTLSAAMLVSTVDPPHLSNGASRSPSLPSRVPTGLSMALGPGWGSASCAPSVPTDVRSAPSPAPSASLVTPASPTMPIHDPSLVTLRRTVADACHAAGHHPSIISLSTAPLNNSPRSTSTSSVPSTDPD